MSATPPTAQEAPHAERTRGADGREYWKLTCFCGKTLLAPADGPHKQGRCPQCGTRLAFPLREKHITTGPLPVIPATRDEPKRIVERVPPKRQSRDQERPSKSRVEPEKSKRHDSSARIKPAHSAADSAAERLRPRRISSDPSIGIVSAWPAAELPRRALAAFIDFTIVVLCVALLFLALPYLPGFFGSAWFLAFFALLLHELNDGVLQVAMKGSIGRKVTVITLLDGGGEQPTPAKQLLRPLLKLLCLHGCLLVFFDADRRAMHDFILNTRVLKGRS